MGGIFGRGIIGFIFVIYLDMWFLVSYLILGCVCCFMENKIVKEI